MDSFRMGNYSSAYASEMTPGWHNKDLTWTGRNSSDWSNTSNWNDW